MCGIRPPDLVLAHVQSLDAPCALRSLTMARAIQFSDLGKQRDRFPWERGRPARSESGQDGRAPRIMQDR